VAVGQYIVGITWFKLEQLKLFDLNLVKCFTMHAFVQ